MTPPKYILIHNDADTEETDVQYFAELQNVTDYVNQERLLPPEFEVYELGKQVEFKLIPTGETK